MNFSHVNLHWREGWRCRKELSYMHLRSGISAIFWIWQLYKHMMTYITCLNIEDFYWETSLRWIYVCVSFYPICFAVISLRHWLWPLSSNPFPAGSGISSRKIGAVSWDSAYGFGLLFSRMMNSCWKHLQRKSSRLIKRHKQRLKGFCCLAQWGKKSKIISLLSQNT